MDLQRHPSLLQKSLRHVLDYLWFSKVLEGSPRIAEGR